MSEYIISVPIAGAITLTPGRIRELHNSSREGTATDAIIRYLCRVALAECCIGDDMPGELRYPTEIEIEDAVTRLTMVWTNRYGGGK